MQFNNKFFSKTLREVSADFTFAELSAETGVNRSVLYSIILHDAAPSLNNLYKLCVWLDIKMESFFTK